MTAEFTEATAAMERLNTVTESAKMTIAPPLLEPFADWHAPAVDAVARYRQLRDWHVWG